MNIYVVRAGDTDLALAHTIRKAVFQEEQGITESDDFDGLDGNAVQFIAYDGDDPIGTARYRLLDGKAKVERVAVLKKYRGLNVGLEIMKKLIDDVRASQCDEIYLESQTSSAKFYKKLGFVEDGPAFEEVGMTHIKMVMKL